MSYVSLRPLVRATMIGDQPVFLDLQADRYVTLDPALHEGFARAAAGQPLADEHLLYELLATGLLQRSDRPANMLTPAPALPARQLHDLPQNPINTSDVVRTWWLVRRTRRSLRGQKLDQLLNSCPGPGLADASEPARRFTAARQFVPIRPSCLQDSLALLGWLGQEKASATLVIGVKLDPFAAHCWVQSSDLVLNDAPDWVGTFTPIFTSR